MGGLGECGCGWAGVGVLAGWLGGHEAPGEMIRVVEDSLVGQRQKQEQRL